MLGNLGNLAGLLKGAKQMQEQMATMQAELAAKRYDGESGAGMVRAVVDGKCTLVDLKIDPQAVEDIELLEDLIKAAVSQAAGKAQDGLKESMVALTGGLNIPGLSDMLGGGGA